MLHDASLSSVAPLPTVVLLPCFATFAGLSTLHYWWLNFQGDQDRAVRTGVSLASRTLMVRDSDTQRGHKRRIAPVPEALRVFVNISYVVPGHARTT